MLSAANQRPEPGAPKRKKLTSCVLLAFHWSVPSANLPSNWERLWIDDFPPRMHEETEGAWHVTAVLYSSVRKSKPAAAFTLVSWSVWYSEILVVFTTSLELFRLFRVPKGPDGVMNGYCRWLVPKIPKIRNQATPPLAWLLTSRNQDAVELADAPTHTCRLPLRGNTPISHTAQKRWANLPKCLALSVLCKLKGTWSENYVCTTQIVKGSYHWLLCSIDFEVRKWANTVLMWFSPLDYCSICVHHTSTP